MRHTSTIHEQKKNFDCKTCTESFSRKRGLISHIKYYHEEAEPVKCDICSDYFYGNRFAQKIALKNHRESVHFWLESIQDWSKKFPIQQNVQFHHRLTLCS